MNDAKTEILRVRMTPMEKAALSRQANDQHNYPDTGKRRYY